MSCGAVATCIGPGVVGPFCCWPSCCCGLDISLWTLAYSGFYLADVVYKYCQMPYISLVGTYLISRHMTLNKNFEFFCLKMCKPGAPG